ncbi:MAG: hypothetical protein DRZ80_03855 [Thermoprotei archaeon]|nr:MAG: hypothetical protein DRZ80_03855 [Thermoprotei archaeon]
MAMIFRPKPIPVRYRDLHQKIRERSYRLDMICNVYRGIWTGVLHVFIVTKEEIEEYHLEEEALKPILRGKDISTFRYKWNERWVIYTAHEDFDKRFPNIIRYLERYKTILERRGAVWVYRRKWWELEDPLSPEMFEVEKILTPYISRFNAFAYEEGKYYTMDSTSIIRFWFDEEELRNYISKWKEVNEPDLNIDEFIETSNQILSELGKNTDALLYLLGILNSELIEFYYKLYAPRLTKRGSRQPVGRFYLYVPPNLNVLPIVIGSEEERRDIVRQVRNIMQVADELNYLEGDEKTSVEEKVAVLMGELNETIYDLYELDDVERAIIQSYVLKKR